MRDPILDRFFQPFINRMQINPRPVAIELAHAFCALQIVGFSRTALSGDLLGPAIGTVLSVCLMQALRTSARHGSSLLSSHFATIHLLSRIVLLAAAAIGFWDIICAIAMEDPAIMSLVSKIPTNLACLAGGVSLYIGVCDQPPRRRRGKNALARA